MKQLTDYTLDELRNIPAGAEADALVQSAIFGDEVRPCGAGSFYLFNGPSGDSHVPNYSTSIADAWRVVDALCARDWDFGMDKNNECSLAFFDNPASLFASAKGTEDPLAIVRASLVTVWME